MRYCSPVWRYSGAAGFGSGGGGAAPRPPGGACAAVSAALAIKSNAIITRDCAVTEAPPAGGPDKVRPTRFYLPHYNAPHGTRVDPRRGCRRGHSGPGGQFSRDRKSVV